MPDGCKELIAFLEAHKGVLDDLVKATDQDSNERGVTIERAADGSLYIGASCIGNSCSLPMPSTEHRIGTFHTHPGLFGETKPVEVFSTGDLIDALFHDDQASCVGRNVHGRPEIMCSCLNTEEFLKWLYDGIVVETRILR